MKGKRRELGWVHPEVLEVITDPFTLFVFMHLQDAAYRRFDKTCRLSSRELAKKAGISEGKTKESLRDLIALGIIHRVENVKLGGGKSVSYYLVSREEWKSPDDSDGSCDDPSRRVTRRPTTGHGVTHDGTPDDPSHTRENKVEKEAEKESASGARFPGQLPRCKEPELPSDPIPEDWQRDADFCKAWFAWIKAKREDRKLSNPRTMKTARTALSNLSREDAIFVLSEAENGAKGAWIAIKPSVAADVLKKRGEGGESDSGVDTAGLGF